MKNRILALQLAGRDTHEWEHHVAEEIKTAEDKDEKVTEKEWFYRGELETKLGKEQTAEFIMKGKFVGKEDEDGDMVYCKARRLDRHTDGTSNVAIARADGQIDAETYSKLSDALSQFGIEKKSAIEGEGGADGGAAAGSGKGGGKGGGRNPGGGKGGGKAGGKAADPDAKQKALVNATIQLFSKYRTQLETAKKTLGKNKMATSIVQSACDLIPTCKTVTSTLREKISSPVFSIKESSDALKAVAKASEQIKTVLKAAKGCI